MISFCWQMRKFYLIRMPRQCSSWLQIIRFFLQLQKKQRRQPQPTILTSHWRGQDRLSLSSDAKSPLKASSSTLLRNTATATYQGRQNNKTQKTNSSQTKPKTPKHDSDLDVLALDQECWMVEINTFKDFRFKDRNLVFTVEILLEKLDLCLDKGLS